MKKIISLLLAVCMIMVTAFSVLAADLPFSDVKKSDWFYNDVKTAYESGVINGKSATEYKPSDNMTYAEAIKLAACMHMLAEEGEINFKASEPWYKTYVDYCKDNKIISKDYEYNKNASRSGYMTIFANCLPDSLLKEINFIEEDSIPDVPGSAAYAPAVYKLYRAGILTGVDEEHNCNPNANIQRSEVAAILTRMNDKSSRVKFTMGDPSKVKEDDNNGKDDTGKDDNNGKDDTGKDSETKETVIPLSAVLSPEEAVLQNNETASLIVSAKGGKAPYTYNWKTKVRTTGSSKKFAGSAFVSIEGDELTEDFPKATYDEGMISFKITKEFFNKYSVLRCEVTDAEGNTVTTNEATLKYGGSVDNYNDLTTDNLILHVEDKFWIEGRGPVVTGRIANGEVKIGDAVKIYKVNGNVLTATVAGIEMFHKTLDKADKGDNVGLNLGGLGNDKDTAMSKLERGDIIAGYNDKYIYTDYVEGTFKLENGSLDSGEAMYAYNVVDRAAVLYSETDEAFVKGEETHAALAFSNSTGIYYVGETISIRKEGLTLGTFTVEKIEYPWWLEDAK